VSSRPSSQKARSMVRRSRALGLALTPKAERLMAARDYPPGEHGRRRRPNQSDYAVRLLEKQRLRAQYGLREAQLRRVVEEAQGSGGRTGDVLVELLERRLDAVVLRAGLARTIAQARQSVVHRHITVDGARVDKPSYRVRPGQVVEVHERSRPMVPFRIAAAGGHAEVLPRVPPYLAVALTDLRVEILRDPRRTEVPITCEVALVVEHYAR
jgi:small subunit ribosomal protein S4